MGIKILKEISIRCDAPSCSENDVEEVLDKKHGLLIMRKRGWVITKSGVFCSKHVPFLHSREVKCPSCERLKLTRGEHIKRSMETNKDHPERIGLCNKCRMRIVKPASKK